MPSGRLCLSALLSSLVVAASLPAAGPDDFNDPFLAAPAESQVIPAEAVEVQGTDSNVQTADVLGESTSSGYGTPNTLFPDGRPEAPPEVTYPDGAIPIQYPLDNDAYRGLPDANPGSSPGWTPSPAAPESEIPAIPDPAVGWKTVKTSLTQVFGDTKSFGITTFDLRGTLEFGGLRGFFVSPQFGWHLLAGPRSTDMPPQLYDLSLDFSMYRPVGDKWLFNVALTPSIFTDGNNLSGEALRMMGRGMAYYTASPTLQWAGGIVYLDRTDLPVLPAFGVICTPREDVRFELVMPRPRLAWRQWYSPVDEQWVYLTGELGGQSWAVQRASGADDVATYRDLRVILGLERKQTSGQSWFVEGGYVFDREIEYESNVGGASFNNTGFLRVGGTF